MVGTFEVFRKELSDHFSGKRFYILFFIFYGLSLGTVFTSFPIVLEGVERTSGEFIFLDLFTYSPATVNLSFMQLISFFGPIIGFIFTFDSICRETSRGTLYFSMSQPIHRDSLINGKFLATFFVIVLFLTGAMASIIGIAMIKIGIAPTATEVIRLTVFWGICMAYISFWAALGLLFSILFDRSATSVLASLSVWLFFAIFIHMIGTTLETFGISYLTLLCFTPPYMYLQASSVALFPLQRFIGPVSLEKVVGMVPLPLSTTQSISLVLPQIIFLIIGTFVIFLICYVKFMRQEIRPS